MAHRSIKGRKAGLGNHDRQLTEQRLEAIPIARTSRASQRERRDLDDQRRLIPPLLNGQQCIDQCIRVRANPSDAPHQLRHGRTRCEAVVIAPFVRHTVPCAPCQLPFEPIRQIHVRHGEDRTSHDCSPRCSPDTSPNPSPSTSSEGHDTRRDIRCSHSSPPATTSTPTSHRCSPRCSHPAEHAHFSASAYSTGHAGDRLLSRRPRGRGTIERWRANLCAT